MSDSKCTTVIARKSNGQFPKGVLSTPKPIQPGQRISPKTEFQSGHTPANKLSLGAETIRQQRGDKPRVWVKVAEPNTWKLRAVVEWEQYAGPIPAGFVVHHIDEDTLNDDIRNLSMIVRAGHAKVHCRHLKATEFQAGHVVPERTVICTICGTEYVGKYQRQTSLCVKCRKTRHNEATRRYKQRIRHST